MRPSSYYHGMQPNSYYHGLSAPHIAGLAPGAVALILALALIAAVATTLRLRASRS